LKDEIDKIVVMYWGKDKQITK